MAAGELRRRLIHLSGAVVPLTFLADVASWRGLRLFYVSATALALLLEGLRLIGRLDWRIYDRLTREYEQEHLAGYALYAIGATLTALAFPAAIAVPAILMLSVGDPISGLLGSNELRLVKRPRVLAVTFGVCAAIGAWLLPPLPAVVGAGAATVADGVKPRVAGYVLDDNVTIPLGAAAAMWVAGRWLAPLL